MSTTAEVKISVDTSAAERSVDALFKKERTLNVNVKGGQPLGRITGDLSEFDKSMAAANARVIAFGASASVVYGIEKAFHSLIDSTIEVQKALNQVQVILNASDNQMTKFGSSLFNVAKQTGQTFETVAEAATLLSRQGLGMEETLKRTNDALVLSRITGMDAAKSVQALTAAVNSFTSQAVTATEVVNKFATVDTQFAIGAKDLPEALGRVGSSAAQAGVSLDQLIALVTAAQVATARGGAVIGNSFKTIFTRLDRPKTQSLLESMGIKTTDENGKIKGTIELLQELAKSYDTLNRTQQAQVAEKVGGVFQINILKATLADLNREYSVYNNALRVSQGATDDAYKRNEALNQTYSSQLNALKLNATQLAATAGESLFGPSMKKLIGGGNSLLGGLNEADSNSVGSKLGKGIMDGLGQFIAGPGLALIGGVLVKLLADFTKFAASGAKDLLGLNNAAKDQEALQKSITEILSKDPSIYKQIESGAASVNEVATRLLANLKLQTVELELQSKLSAEIAAQAYGGGARIGPGGVPRVKAAGGYIPQFAEEESMARSMGAGSDVRAMWGKGTIGGQPFIMNNKEREIPNFGGSGDSAVIPRYAGGWVPNFADYRLEINNLGKGGATLAKLIGIDGGGTPWGDKGTNIKSALDQINKGRFKISDGDIEKLKSLKDSQVANRPPTEVKDNGEPGSITVSGGQGGSEKTVNFDNYDLANIDETIASKYGVFTPTGGQVGIQSKQRVSEISRLKGLRVTGHLVTRLPGKSIFPLNIPEGDFDKVMDQAFYPPVRQVAGLVAKSFQPIGKKTSQEAIIKGIEENVLTPAVKGSLFEKILGAASVKSSEIFAKSNDIKKDQDAFDYDPIANYPYLQKALNISVAGEAKNSLDAAHNLPGKILRKDSAVLEALKTKILKATEPQKKAAGYIPNFADALHESIAREIGAGAPSGGIYVKQYSELAGANNPMGLGVFNSRDEGSPSKERGAIRRKGYAAGYIPNFADDSSGSNSSSYAAVGIELSGLATMLAFGSNGIREEYRKQIQTISAANKNISEGSLKLKAGLAAGGSNIALAVSTLGPIITSTIANNIDQSTKSGRGSASATKGIGDILSYGGTGAMIGTAIEPVIGTGIGAVAGVLVGLTTTIMDVGNQLKTDIPELEAAFKKASENQTQIQQQSTNIIQTATELKELTEANKPENAEKIIATKAKLTEQISSYTGSADRATLISDSVGNIEKLVADFAKDRRNSADQTAKARAEADVAAELNKGKFSGPFGGGVGITNFEKTAALGNREAMAGVNMTVENIQKRLTILDSASRANENSSLSVKAVAEIAGISGVNFENFKDQYETQAQQRAALALLVRDEINQKQEDLNSAQQLNKQQQEAADAAAAAAAAQRQIVEKDRNYVAALEEAIKAAKFNISFGQERRVARANQIAEMGFGGAGLQDQIANIFSGTIGKARAEAPLDLEQEILKSIGKEGNPANLTDEKMRAIMSEALKPENTKGGVYNANAIANSIGASEEFLAVHSEDKDKGLKAISDLQKAIEEGKSKLYDAQREATTLSAQKIDELIRVNFAGLDRVGGGIESVLSYKNPSQTGDDVAKAVRDYNLISNSKTANSADISKAILDVMDSVSKLTGGASVMTTSDQLFKDLTVGIKDSLSKSYDIGESKLMSMKGGEGIVRAIEKDLLERTGEVDRNKALADIAEYSEAKKHNVEDTTGLGSRLYNQVLNEQLEKFERLSSRNNAPEMTSDTKAAIELAIKSGATTGAKDATAAQMIVSNAQDATAFKDINQFHNDYNTKTDKQIDLLRKIAINTQESAAAGKPSTTVTVPSSHAAGYVPNFVNSTIEESLARSLGAKNPRAHYGRGRIGGKRFLMNSEEMEIPNFAGGPDSAVIPMYADGNLPLEMIDLSKVKTKFGTYYNPKKSGLGTRGKFSGLNFGTEEMSEYGYNTTYTKDIKINKELFSSNLSSDKFSLLEKYTPAELRRFVAAHEAHHASGDIKTKPILTELYNSSETFANFQGGFSAPRGANAIQRIGSGISAVIDYWNDPRTLDHYAMAKSERFKSARGHLSRMTGPYADEYYDLKKPLSDTEKKLLYLFSKKWAEFNSGGKGAFINRDANLITNLEESAGKILSGKALSSFLGNSVKGAGLVAGDVLGLLGSVPGQILGGAESMGDATADTFIERERDRREKAQGAAMAAAISREIAGGAPASSIYTKSWDQLKNPLNPMGLGVFNSRDEGSPSSELNAIIKKGYAVGHIPNFVKEDEDKEEAARRKKVQEDLADYGKWDTTQETAFLFRGRQVIFEKAAEKRDVELMKEADKQMSDELNKGKFSGLAGWLGMGTGIDNVEKVAKIGNRREMAGIAPTVENIQLRLKKLEWVENMLNIIDEVKKDNPNAFSGRDGAQRRAEFDIGGEARGLGLNAKNNMNLARQKGSDHEYLTELNLLLQTEILQMQKLLDETEKKNKDEKQRRPSVSTTPPSAGVAGRPSISITPPSAGVAGRPSISTTPPSSPSTSIIRGAITAASLPPTSAVQSNIPASVSDKDAARNTAIDNRISELPIIQNTTRNRLPQHKNPEDFPWSPTQGGLHSGNRAGRLGYHMAHRNDSQIGPESQESIENRELRNKRFEIERLMTIRNHAMQTGNVGLVNQIDTNKGDLNQAWKDIKDEGIRKRKEREPEPDAWVQEARQAREQKMQGAIEDKARRFLQERGSPEQIENFNKAHPDNKIEKNNSGKTAGAHVPITINIANSSKEFAQGLAAHVEKHAKEYVEKHMSQTKQIAANAAKKDNSLYGPPMGNNRNV